MRTSQSTSKAQASFEFMVNYGWAILIAILIITAMFSLGLLNFQLNDQCIIYGEFECVDYNIDWTDNELFLLLTHDFQYSLNGVSVGVGSGQCPGVNQSLGAVFSFTDLTVAGEGHTFIGGTFYTTEFVNSSSTDTTFDPLPVQFTGTPKHPFNLTDYQPGGPVAVQAQAKGKYTYIEGDLLNPSTLDGLYYVTGEVVLNDSAAISGTVTIVSAGKMDISGSEKIYSSYVDNLLFFSSSSGKNTLKFAGNSNSFVGYFYSPDGEIKITGTDISVLGGLIGAPIEIGGNTKTITYAPLEPVAFKLVSGAVPEPWKPGDYVLLVYKCLEGLPQYVKGTIDVNFTTQGTGLTNYGEFTFSPS